MDKEIILIDKPKGVSSFFCVSKVRREISDKLGPNEQRKRRKVKVGHAGTLDPFATGLLILLVGKGTKRAGEFLKLDKEYEAEICLGKVSTTGDPEGSITECSLRLPATVPGKQRSLGPSLRASAASCSAAACATFPETVADPAQHSRLLPSIPTLEEISNVVKSFVGEIEQRVPEFSAVKINGKRAYKLAREGKKVEMPVRKIKIYNIEILKYEWPMLKIRCSVSSGTYIRQLGMDIGEKLGTGAYLTELRRTKIDKYDVKDAEKLYIAEK